MLESSKAYVYSTLDLQALIYKLTVETLLPLEQTWKLISKHVKVAAITTAVTFAKGRFTYDQIENKLHENLKNRLKTLGKKSASKAPNSAERGDFLLYKTGAG
jgi:predicted transcriptional regulator